MQKLRQVNKGIVLILSLISFFHALVFVTIENIVIWHVLEYAGP